MWSVLLISIIRNINDTDHIDLELLGCGKVALDQLAQMARFTNDYERYY